MTSPTDPPQQVPDPPEGCGLADLARKIKAAKDSLPDPTAGTVLGEEARQNIRLTLPARGIRGEETFQQWSVEWTASGAWIQEGRTAVTRDEPDARMMFVPMPVMESLLSAAREAGRAEGRKECAEE